MFAREAVVHTKRTEVPLLQRVGCQTSSHSPFEQGDMSQGDCPLAVTATARQTRQRGCSQSARRAGRACISSGTERGTSRGARSSLGAEGSEGGFPSLGRAWVNSCFPGAPSAGYQLSPAEAIDSLPRPTEGQLLGACQRGIKNDEGKAGSGKHNTEGEGGQMSLRSREVGGRGGKRWLRGRRLRKQSGRHRHGRLRQEPVRRGLRERLTFLSTARETTAETATVCSLPAATECL